MYPGSPIREIEQKIHKNNIVVYREMQKYSSKQITVRIQTCTVDFAVNGYWAFKQPVNSKDT